ncbi:hypothetical protein, partial [Pseudomonas profundi]|uniref:hypothetical protein n=1 Tax=Pseudomonas profundi TaxID=1981513 RepID=UPI001CC2274D
IADKWVRFEPSLTYATYALKNRLVKCKYMAAAAIFARVAVYSAEDPSNGISYHWTTACERAIILSGANDEEASVVMQSLLEMNEQVQPLFSV